MTGTYDDEDYSEESPFDRALMAAYTAVSDALELSEPPVEGLETESEYYTALRTALEALEDVIDPEDTDSEDPPLGDR